MPTVDIEGCRRAHRVLLDRIAGLSDSKAREASLLPDWTVGHVLTHLARNAESVVRRLEGAVRGEIVDQYPGGYAGRAAEIAAGAGRPAADLVKDVAETAGHLEAACLAAPDAAWDRPTRNVSGAERPARTMMLARWREVEVHHADLGLGYGSADWPDGLVRACLTRELERLPQRTDPKVLLAWLIGRQDPPDLSNW
ncbi:MAG: maleylpyruvate isomerase N-terminal domain-containing protein [Acidimicrobiales bacterium]